jgi:hypothetical protein
MTEQELIKEYNKIVDFCQQQTANSNTEILAGLSNHALEIFIAGKTYQYGRSFEASMKNAKNHMLNRDLAILMFCKGDIEKYAGTI